VCKTHKIPKRKYFSLTHQYILYHQFWGRLARKDKKGGDIGYKIERTTTVDVNA